jgi:hypothetical protein
MPPPAFDAKEAAKKGLIVTQNVHILDWTMGNDLCSKHYFRLNRYRQLEGRTISQSSERKEMDGA